MALTLNGTTTWPGAKELHRLGETRIGASPARIREIMERIREAIADISKEMRAYIKDHQEFEQIGSGMLRQWELGVMTSLKTV